MMRNKIIIGITGGSGCGKSRVSEILRALGVYVIDADIIAREITKKGEPAFREIESAFGNTVIAADGSLDRKVLAEIVFSDRKSLELLNSITHSHISRKIFSMIDESGAHIAGIDAAALIESGIDKKCDFIIAVTASRDIRKQRIMARDGLSEKQAQARINAQMEDAFYTQFADFVIENNSGEYNLEKQVKKIMDRIMTESEKAF